MARLTAGLSLLVLVGAAIGLCASLALATDRLGATRLSVPRCTTAGLGVVQNLSGANVVSVTVSNLPAGCGGATMLVTVNNLTTNQSGSNNVPAGGGSVTVSLTAAIAAATTDQTDIVITGP